MLHNVLTNERLPEECTQRLLNYVSDANGEYLKFREEIFINRDKPLSAVIHKQKLPTFSTARVVSTLVAQQPKIVVKEVTRLERSISNAKRDRSGNRRYTCI